MKPPTLMALAAALALTACIGTACRKDGDATATAPTSTSTPPAAVALEANPAESAPQPVMSDPTRAGAPATTETITLGAGCFWCIEAVLERVDGVVDVDSGYMGGDVDHPTYRQVCEGDTGHAEVVKVVFDPQKLPLRALLDWFFKAHDPTTLNSQGNDYGTQYRSAIFVTGDEQRRVAQEALAAAQAHHKNRIVTEITEAGTFWPAEDYHQDYFAKNPTQGYCRAIIPPKLEKLGLSDKPRAK